jgi:hypothetical protein
MGYRAVVFVSVVIASLGPISTATAEQETPEKPDTTSASDIYNPPRVITPEYRTGPEPPDTGAAVEPVEPGAEAPEPVAAENKRCASRAGDRGSRVGGGGELVIGYLFADLNELNSQVRLMGIPELSENILMVGGKGYARIGHLVIGGAGHSGETESSGVPDCCRRYARIQIAYGGLILGIARSQARYEAMAGMLFGTGSVEITRERNSRSVPTWEDAWGVFHKDGPDTVSTEDLNVTSIIKGDFIALEPFIGLKYRIMPFLALDFSASYLSAEIKRGGWEVDGVVIPDSPESNIGGLTLKLGLHFGVW